MPCVLLKGCWRVVWSILFISAQRFLGSVDHSITGMKRSINPSGISIQSTTTCSSTSRSVTVIRKDTSGWLQIRTLPTCKETMSTKGEWKILMKLVVMYNLGVKLMYQFLSMQHNYSRHYKYRRYIIMQ